MNLRDHLQVIHDQRGTLNAALVVEAARPATHPLHAHVFDCPPKVASERYYLSRAAQLLRVTYRPSPESPNEIRAFVAVKGEDSERAAYHPSDKAFTDPVSAEIVLRQMKREWFAFQRRYEHHAEFAALIQDYIQKGTAA